LWKTVAIAVIEADLSDVYRDCIACLQQRIFELVGG
jgi:hypothetical protein